MFRIRSITYVVTSTFRADAKRASRVCSSGESQSEIKRLILFIVFDNRNHCCPNFVQLFAGPEPASIYGYVARDFARSNPVPHNGCTNSEVLASSSNAEKS